MCFNWRNPQDLELRKANTKAMICPANRPLRPDHAHFVLTRYRDLYLAPFSPSWPGFPKYHSTIPEKTAVQCAGSLLIEEGVVIEICNGSGHYMPGDLYFVNVLEQLKTLGVTPQTIQGISLWDYAGNEIAEDAAEYLKEHGNWDEIQKRKEMNRKRRAEGIFAVRAAKYKTRLDALMKNHLEDEAFGLLFAEEFAARIGYGGQGSPSLWTETWKSILDALLEFAKNAYDKADPKRKALTQLIEKKIAEYKVRPPIPPKPKNQKNLTYV
jgi:hypothetical protein